MSADSSVRVALTATLSENRQGMPDRAPIWFSTMTEVESSTKTAKRKRVQVQENDVELDPAHGALDFASATTGSTELWLFQFPKEVGVILRCFVSHSSCLVRPVLSERSEIKGPGYYHT